jgi:hypothetical protein
MATMFPVPDNVLLDKAEPGKFGKQVWSGKAKTSKTDLRG